MAEFKIRATKKGILTRYIRRSSLQVQLRKVDAMNSISAELERLFDEFESSHETYVLTLDDGADIEAAGQYYDEVFRDYFEVTKNVNELVENPIKIPELQARDETSMALSLSQTLNLPRIEIDKFDGNPRHYTSFMASFRQCVESITSDNHTRLSQLLYHTNGEARTAISSFINTPDGTGFDLAMKRLKSRFGSPHVICETVLSDLNDYPDVHTPHDIRQFADQLNNASVILKEHSMYSEMDTQNFILCMCLKLPVRIRYKWRDHATDSLEKRNLYPNFQDFVVFVERQASVLTDPVYGGDALSGSTRRSLRPSTMQPSKKTSIFTSAARRPMCSLCSQDHKLFMCSKFRDKSLSERIVYVNDNKLCYICLSSTHATNDCMSTYKCTVNDCMAKHSKFLHVDRPNCSNINSVSVSLNAHCNVSMLMPILPVTVNGVYDTYALLDTGSSHSFCSDALKKELKLNGPMMRYDLSTLDRTSQTESQLVHFQLTSRRNSRSVSMKHVRVTDVIPVHSASCDVTAFPHLKDICCPGDVRVDILIGQDYPHLLRPIDVRTGRDDDPFAVLTTLGWTLNGPVTSQPKKRMVSSNLISSTNIEKKLDQLYEFDAEPAPVDPSHTDQHFCISHHTVPKQHKKIRVVSDDTDLRNDVSLPIHSLQEPNVTSSEAELHRILKQHDFNIINKFSTRHTIHWSFRPPTA